MCCFFLKDLISIRLAFQLKSKNYRFWIDSVWKMGHTELDKSPSSMKYFVCSPKVDFKESTSASASCYNHKWLSCYAKSTGLKKLKIQFNRLNNGNLKLKFSLVKRNRLCYFFSLCHHNNICVRICSMVEPRCLERKRILFLF